MVCLAAPAATATAMAAPAVSAVAVAAVRAVAPAPAASSSVLQADIGFPEYRLVPSIRTRMLGTFLFMMFNI